MSLFVISLGAEAFAPRLPFNTMNSAGLRHGRRNAVGAVGKEQAHPKQNQSNSPPRSPRSSSVRSSVINHESTDIEESLAGHEPPRFIIDLSVPPEHRYDHITPHLLAAVKDASVTAQFDELLETLLPQMPVAQKVLHILARVFLRRVYSDEETAEIRGIAKSTGLSIHILVALNVMLDILLGCTSGGVRFRDSPNGESKMIHYRVLDWGMDPLRSLIIELDFVAYQGGPVLATTVGYFGYVGVLTGVRPGLSISLNYRPHHDTSTFFRRVSFRWHQLLVVLGFRPSISSTLRSFLLPSTPKSRDGHHFTTTATNNNDSSDVKNAPSQLQPLTTSISTLLGQLSTSRSTAAYLILCTPQVAYSVEKDNCSASITSSVDFLATCNHDLSDETSPSGLTRQSRSQSQGKSHGETQGEGGTQGAGVEDATGMEFIVEDSLDRKEAVTRMWEEKVKSASSFNLTAKGRGKGRAKVSPDEKGSGKPSGKGVGNGTLSSRVATGATTSTATATTIGTNTNTNTNTNANQERRESKEGIPALNLKDVLELISQAEISHEMTHYAVVMDPSEGRLLWRRAYQVGELGEPDVQGED